MANGSIAMEEYKIDKIKTFIDKNYDSYFVEFTYPIKIEDGELTNQILDWISYIQICKRIGSDYRTIYFNASSTVSVEFTHILNWNYTRANLNPKASNTKLYEVPEELNGLFRKIQMEAYNHR